jgi:outer membrane lipoprotein SlyB
VTAAEDTANTLTVTFSELKSAKLHQLTVLRSNAILSSAGAAIGGSANQITIGDGGGYTLTADDVLNITAIEE